MGPKYSIIIIKLLQVVFSKPSSCRTFAKYIHSRSLVADMSSVLIAVFTCGQFNNRITIRWRCVTGVSLLIEGGLCGDSEMYLCIIIVTCKRNAKSILLESV